MILIEDFPLLEIQILSQNLSNFRRRGAAQANYRIRVSHEAMIHRISTFLQMQKLIVKSTDQILNIAKEFINSVVGSL